MTDGSTARESSGLLLKQVIGQQVLPKYLKPWFEAYTQYERQPEFVNTVESSTENREYQKSVLKLFIRNIESDHTKELHEDVFEAYASYMIPSLDETERKNIVNYAISPAIAVRLYEEPNVIAREGGTGHRTWEAALALADYLVDTSSFQTTPRSFVELGAGTGLVGLVACQLPYTEQVVLTDGDTTVVDNLEENMRLNSGTIGSKVCSQKLWWNKDPPVSLVNTEATIIAADVTYDSDLFPALVQCIKQHLALPSTDNALVSATIRSPETYQAFLDECATNSVKVHVLKTYTSPFASRHFFISPESPDIAVLRLEL
ncbi:Efm3p [Sugiyamaella lignohabitans]|uniref:Efm3p n=1 Tax=Sugiyamaella lignohabitans TaxID=796027 RepID=A0A167CD49_9ASCO|nr:Efm3p [Sugiyamaella lignohabitans]ANB11533.1 Efm3p [Sugiyamaella lignohabitans]